jgi:hypothetical protein
MWLRINTVQTADLIAEAFLDPDILRNVAQAIADRFWYRDRTSVIYVTPTVCRAILRWSEDKGLLDKAYRLRAEAMRTRRQSRVTDPVESPTSYLKVIAVQAVSLVCT